MSRKKRYQPLPPDSYWTFSQQPLQALIFLLPLLIAYEAGVIWYMRSDGRALIAEQSLMWFFEALGANQLHLPPLVVVVLLLCWHFVRRDKMDFDARCYLLMAAESVLWAAPLLVFGILLQQQMAQAGGGGSEDWREILINSIGAGIYEELVFRLIAIAIIHGLIVDILSLPEKWGAMAAILLSSIAFALIHFTVFGGDRPFALGDFIFMTLAGVYFAAVYLLRGFGIVVGVHAMYDIFVLILKLKTGG